jgi:hypothetical protein
VPPGFTPTGKVIAKLKLAPPPTISTGMLGVHAMFVGDDGANAGDGETGAGAASLRLERAPPWRGSRAQRPLASLHYPPHNQSGRQPLQSNPASANVDDLISSALVRFRLLRLPHEPLLMVWREGIDAKVVHRIVSPNSTQSLGASETSLVTDWNFR